MSKQVCADIVGSVMRVVAHEGDTITLDTDLVILESMKMEIPVRSEYAGTLVELKVHEGDVVQEGDVIAVVEE